MNAPTEECVSSSHAMLLRIGKISSHAVLRFMLPSVRFDLAYDPESNIVTAITRGMYDPAIARNQMHRIISIPGLPEKIRALRVLPEVKCGWSSNELNEHSAHVQEYLLAIVTDVPVNTALGFLYQSNRNSGECS